MKCGSNCGPELPEFLPSPAAEKEHASFSDVDEHISFTLEAPASSLAQKLRVTSNTVVVGRGCLGVRVAVISKWCNSTETKNIFPTRIGHTQHSKSHAPETHIMENVLSKIDTLKRNNTNFTHQSIYRFWGEWLNVWIMSHKAFCHSIITLWGSWICKITWSFAPEWQWFVEFWLAAGHS